MQIKVTLKGDHTFVENDDWNVVEAYQNGGIEGVKQVLRDDMLDVLGEMGTMDELLTIEVIE